MQICKAEESVDLTHIVTEFSSHLGRNFGVKDGVLSL
jgi:hypothetical protein